MMVLLLLVAIVGSVCGQTYDKQCHKCPYFVHPETVYCVSDIVAKIKVDWNVTNAEENTETYGITVKHIEKLKKGLEGKVTVENLNVMDEQCYSFNKVHPGEVSGKTYLVMASIWINEKGNPHIVLTPCSYSTAVNDMNCYQRKGVFKGSYGSNCNCVNVVGDSVKLGCPEMNKSNMCYKEYAYCKNHGDHCGWQEFWKFRDCE